MSRSRLNPPPSKIPPCFEELNGLRFVQPGTDRVFVLLPTLSEHGLLDGVRHYSGGWSLCGAWGGYKGYDPFEVDKTELLPGYVDMDLLNPCNYYHFINLPPLKSVRSILSDIVGRGFLDK